MSTYAAKPASYSLRVTDHSARKFGRAAHARVYAAHGACSNGSVPLPQVA